MTTIKQPEKSVTVLITIGTVMFVGAGLAVAILAWTQGEPRRQTETLPAALALGGIIALPGVVAALALHKLDPRLLWPAVVTGLLAALVTITSIGMVLIIPVLLFVQAALRWPQSIRSRSWRRDLVIPALAVLAGLTFFAHQDPACWDYLEDVDGRVTYTSTNLHAGMQGSWFAGGGVTGLVVDSADGDGSGSVCVSDRITPIEAAIALLFIGGAAALAMRPAGKKEIRSASDS